MTKKQLVEKLGEALKKDFLAIQEAAGEVVGFALMTDDNVETLGYIWLTKSAHSSAGTPDELLFCQVEWETEGEISKEVEVILDELDTFEEMDRYWLIVDALDTLPRAKELFFSVFSSDPSDEMLKAELEASRRLNSDEIAKRHAEVLE